MQASRLYGVTISLAKAGLTAGTTSTYTTTAATAGAIAGKCTTPLAVQTNTATPTSQGDGSSFTVVAKNRGSVFVFCTDIDGAIKVFQGSVEDLDDSGNFEIVPQFPTVDFELYMPFGYVLIRNGSSGSDWTFGSNNWDATGITDTFVDIATLPQRPQEP